MAHMLKFLLTNKVSIYYIVNFYFVKKNINSFSSYFITYFWEIFIT